MLAACLTMPALAMAQPTPGLSSLDPFGAYIPNVAIYCVNSAGAAVLCTFSGSGSNAAAGTVNSTAPGSASSTGYTNAAGNLVPVAPATPMPTGDATAEAALGTPADAAWGGSGSGSSIALAKALYGALVANTAVNAAYATATAMTVGGTALSTPTRGLELNCTGSGNVTVQLGAGGTFTFPVIGYAAGADIGPKPYAITQVVSATATCTYTGWN